MNEEMTFWCTALKKAGVTAGFAFFSSLVALQLAGIDQILPVLYAAGIGGGAYLFGEAVRYYGIQPEKKVLPSKRIKPFVFMI